MPPVPPGWRRRVHFIRANRTWGGKLVPRLQKGFPLLGNVLGWKFISAAACAVRAGGGDGSNTHSIEHARARSVSLLSPSGDSIEDSVCYFCQVEWKERPWNFHTRRCRRDHFYCSTRRAFYTRSLTCKRRESKWKLDSDEIGRVIICHMCICFGLCQYT